MTGTLVLLKSLTGPSVPILHDWSGSARGAIALLGMCAEEIMRTHPIRTRIVERLSLLPGDHFRSIVRALGIGQGDAEYHLRVLVRNGFVREEKVNGRRRFYTVGSDADLEKNALFARHWALRDLRLRVLFTVRNQGAVTPGSIAGSLGISRQLAAYHLGRLVELGFLRKERGHYRA